MKCSICTSKILRSAVAAGQVEQVIPLGRVSFSKKRRKKKFEHRIEKHIKRIKSDDRLQWADDCTTVPYGITVTGLAFWDDTQATVINSYTYRHRLLYLCRPGDCRLYAIPMSLAERKFTLPDIELADDELEAYRYIADRISPKPKEITSTVNHPAKTAIKNNGCDWMNKPLDLGGFSDMLKANSEWLTPILIAALDTQLRSFSGCDGIPVFCYNFTLKKVNLQADSNFIRVLTAMNFTVQDGACSAAPREITVQDNGDIEDWNGCHDRLVVLRTVKGGGLAPIFDKLDTYDRSRAYKGVLPPRLSTVPIIRSKTFFDRSDTVDCELPEVIPALTDAQLSWLRTAFSHVLTKENAADASKRWRDRMYHMCGFLRNPFEEWRDVLHRVFLDSVFPKQGQARKTAQTGFQTAQKRQKEAEKEREKILQDALDLVRDQSSYEDKIIDKPATADEAKERLKIDPDAVAFRHSPTVKKYAGRHFIIFTEQSLLRFLKPVGMTEELYNVFKARAVQMADMIDDRHSVKIKGETVYGFWFPDQKF